MHDFSTAVVRPGDTLVLCFEKPVTDTQVERLREQAREALPDVRLAVIEGVKGLAVYRPADSAGERP